MCSNLSQKSTFTGEGGTFNMNHMGFEGHGGGVGGATQNPRWSFDIAFAQSSKNPV